MQTLIHNRHHTHTHQLKTYTQTIRCSYFHSPEKKIIPLAVLQGSNAQHFFSA